MKIKCPKFIIYFTLTFAYSVANAEYIIQMPLEQDLRGALPNGSIIFSPEVEEELPPVEEPPKLLGTQNFTIDENDSSLVGANGWLMGADPMIIQNKGTSPYLEVAVIDNGVLVNTKKISINNVTCSASATPIMQDNVAMVYLDCLNTVLIPFNTPIGASITVSFYDK